MILLYEIKIVQSVNFETVSAFKLVEKSPSVYF
jgi:hypothetical protein